MFESKISPRFRVLLEQLQDSFPVAWQFLSYVKNHSNEGFWLSTSRNAHLYYKNLFLAYIQVSPNGIQFSPKYNGKIWEQTVDRHQMIFPEVFYRLTKQNDGKLASWARFSSDGTIKITNQVPPEFFSNLIKEIKQIQ